MGGMGAFLSGFLGSVGDTLQQKKAQDLEMKVKNLAAERQAWQAVISSPDTTPQAKAAALNALLSSTEQQQQGGGGGKKGKKDQGGGLQDILHAIIGGAPMGGGQQPGRDPGINPNVKPGTSNGGVSPLQNVFFSPEEIAKNKAAAEEQLEKARIKGEIDARAEEGEARGLKGDNLEEYSLLGKMPTGVAPLQKTEEEAGYNEAKAANPSLSRLEYHKQWNEAGKTSVATPGKQTEEEQSYAQEKEKNPKLTFLEFHKKWKLAEKNATGGGSGSTTLDPAELDELAELWHKTKTLPALGFGKDAAAMRAAILNRAGKLYPKDDVAANAAMFHADTGALNKLVSQRAAVSAFEKTAGKNLDLFLTQVKPLIDSGSPIINAPVRSISEQLFGSEQVAKYRTARQVALTEIARVINNPNLTGVLSDSGRKEVEELNPETATLKQIYATVSVLKQDMKNRLTSFDDEINEVKGRIRNGDGQPGAPPAQQNNSSWGAKYGGTQVGGSQ